MGRKHLSWAITIAFAAATGAAAIAFRPQKKAASESDVRVPALEEIVYRRSGGIVRAAQRAVARVDAGANVAPSVEASVRDADALLRAFRRDQDPRHLGRAQAILAPWWNEPEPDVEISLLRGMLRQSSHDFPGALTDLDRVVRHDPSRTQAWLVRAAVQTVTADYDAARESCSHVPRATFALEHAVCIGSVDAATGHSARAVDLVRDETAAAERRPSGTAEAAWASSCLAEFLVQRGDIPAARARFVRSLELDPADLYTRAAYMDVLLYEREYEHAFSVGESHADADAILLRRAIAAKHMHHADEKMLTGELRARFDASRLRGDSLHAREEARFRLEVLDDAPGAVRLAIENFGVQREPADVRILAEASCATGNAVGLTVVQEFVATHGLEDPFVKRALAGCAK